MKVWTLEEVADLRHRYSQLPDKELASIYGATLDEIQAKARSLGLGKDKRVIPGCESRPWTDEEVERLTDLFSDYSSLEVARLLSRSAKAVNHKARRLGLLKSEVRRSQAGRDNIRNRQDR